MGLKVARDEEQQCQLATGSGLLLFFFLVTQMQDVSN